MTGPFLLRPATPADAEACARVHHASWRQTYADVLPTTHWETDTVEARTARWRTWLEGGLAVTLAEATDGVVGLAAAGAPHPQGGHEPVRPRELRILYVLEEHHGSGVGQALLDAVLPDGAAAQLWVADPNPRARRFYERNGFAADGARLVDDAMGIAEVRLVR